MLDRLPHAQVAGACRALAGLSGSLSVLAGIVAARASPHGFSRFAVAMHLEQAPLAIRLAPIFALIAGVVAAAAGIVSFYAWCREPRDTHSVGAGAKQG